MAREPDAVRRRDEILALLARSRELVERSVAARAAAEATLAEAFRLAGALGPVPFRRPIVIDFAAHRFRRSA